MRACVCLRARIFLFPARASALLAQLEPSVARLLGGRDLVMPFSGIDHFRKEVVFVGLATGQHTHTLESLAGQSSVNSSSLLLLRLLFATLTFSSFLYLKF